MSELPVSVGWYVKKYGYKTDICLFRAMDEYAAHVTAEKDAEIERLRRLDAEYGRLESAIIMADPDFDGDSDHPDCISRLMDSVRRIQGRLAKLEAVMEVAREALEFLKGIEGAGYGGMSEYDALVGNLKTHLGALNGEKADG